MNILEYWSALRYHDWTYEYSDCHSVWERGNDMRRKLEGLRKLSIEHELAYQDWSDYIMRGGRAPMLFGIVNDVDKPCERLLAKRCQGGLTYVDAELHKHYPVMGIERATDVVAFGFEMTQVEGGMLFKQIAPSQAKYDDGRVREWQGSKEFLVRL